MRTIYHLRYLLFVLVGSFDVGIAGFPSIEDDVVDEGSVREFCLGVCAHGERFVVLVA